MQGDPKYRSNALIEINQIMFLETNNTQTNNACFGNKQQDHPSTPTHPWAIFPPGDGPLIGFELRWF